MKINKLILFLLIHKNYKDLENFLINQLKEKYKRLHAEFRYKGNFLINIIWLNEIKYINPKFKLLKQN